MSLKKTYFKVCIVGNFGVGKTTLLYQFLEKRFHSNVESTIGSNFFVKYVQIPQTKNYVTLQIWDLGGQDHFRWVRRAFYIGTKGVVYVFDLTRRETFEKIRDWKKEVEKIAGFIPNVLVGNKCDLIDQKIVSNEESLSLKREIGACAFAETSAKLGTGVDEIFNKLSLEMNKILK